MCIREEVVDEAEVIVPFFSARTAFDVVDDDALLLLLNSTSAINSGMYGFGVIYKREMIEKLEKK